jgi:hypothetical protein
MPSHPFSGLVALLAGTAALAACTASTDPFTSGPAHASVTGVVTAPGGAPLADTPVSIQCEGGSAPVNLTTDSTGRYIANLSSGPHPFPGRGGHLRCQFAEPDVSTPRLVVDTVLGFARGPVLVALQTVDLHEP